MIESTKPSVDLDAEAAGRRQRWFVYLLLITIAAALGAVSIVTAEPLQSANDRSRWCTVMALVEQQGTYQIDAIIQLPGWDTIDKLRHNEHFYSTKPALFPTLVAGVYWCVREMSPYNLLDDTALVTRIILLIVNLLPMLIALVVTARLVERYARTDAAKFFVVATASLATFLTTFLCTLNNHTVAAVSVTFAIYPALRILVDDSRRPVHFILSGFFAAFACTNELPAALFGVALFGLLVFKAPKETMLYFVPAALVPLAGSFFTTYLQTGSWKPFYMYYGTEKYRYVHEGVPSYWMEPKGLDANREPPLIYLMHCTIGHHGIFSLSPIYLLSLLAWLRIRAWSQFRARLVLWSGLFLTVSILGFYLTRTQNYNYGGNTSGLRWTFWLIPFWLLAMIPVLDQWGNRRWFQGVAVVLLAISIFSTAYPRSNPWQHPWLFTLMEQRGWIDYSTRPPKFDRPLTTWFRSIPTPDESGRRDWIEFTGPDKNGKLLRLRLSNAEPVPENGMNLHRIEVIRNKGQANQSKAVYTLDAKSFAAGDRPAKFLRWPNSRPSAAEREAAYRFFRGLPKYRPYGAGVIRYLKTPLRREAFRCQRAASRVPFSPPGDKRTYWYRQDLWLCADVPFGVVRVETTISDADTGTVVSRSQLNAVKASRVVSAR